MTNPRKSFRSALRWAWSRAGAGVAVVLIVFALFIGYRLGRPAPAQHADAHTHADPAAPPAMYTCSMHPSVRLPDPNAKCPICFMPLIPVRTGAPGSETDPTRLALRETAAAASRIETARVARFFPIAQTRLYGKVTYDQTSVARLTAYFPGRIDRLFVNYLGVPVRKGDHLAEIYSPELLAAFEELRQVRRAADTSTGSDLLRETSRDTLDAAREKLRLFGMTAGQIASVEDGSFDADRLTIYAPIGGVVTNLAVREGDYVERGEPIATLADLSRLWLDMGAYESQLPMLRWGQPVSFTVEAHPGETFTGMVSFIEPMVDERTRTAVVRVAVDNADGRLKPGMFATAVVRTPMSASGAVPDDDLAGRWVGPMHPTVVKDAPGVCDLCGMALVPAESLGIVGDHSQLEEPLVIPRSAVLFTGTRSVVYVEIPDADSPTYEGREIILGPRAGDSFIVREGLTEGESVVVHGAFRIDSAMQIATKPSMMSSSRNDARHASQNAPPAPQAFRAGLEPIYAAYLDAQEALANDDHGAFMRARDALDAAASRVNIAGLPGEHLDAWRRASPDLRTDGPTTTIESARADFERISGAVASLVRRFGHRHGEPLRLVHCPMAFDFKGADWLQRGEAINNPYFGASMLRCGQILESFAAREGAGDE